MNSNSGSKNISSIANSSVKATIATSTTTSSATPKKSHARKRNENHPNNPPPRIRIIEIREGERPREPKPTNHVPIPVILAPEPGPLTQIAQPPTRPNAYTKDPVKGKPTQRNPKTLCAFALKALSRFRFLTPRSPRLRVEMPVAVFTFLISVYPC